MHEKQTPTHSNAGSGTQSFIRMVNFVNWGVSLLKEIQNKITESFRFIFNTKGGN